VKAARNLLCRDHMWVWDEKRDKETPCLRCRIEALQAHLKAVRDYVIDQGSQPRADDGRELLAGKIRDGVLEVAQEAGE
jgi:hypothetical protein